MTLEEAQVKERKALAELTHLEKTVLEPARDKWIKALFACEEVKKQDQIEAEVQRRLAAKGAK